MRNYWVLLLIITLCMVFREVMQLIVAWANKDMMKHIFSLENWLEIAFIVSTIILLLYTALSEQPVCAMRSLAATALLISSILNANIWARNPNFTNQNIHIAMFLTDPV